MMPEIQKVSNKHEAILQHMLANPGQKLGEVAAAFNVSQPWLSCIIHSDAFQRRLRERQDETFHHTVLPIRDKMNIVAHKMLDKLIEAPSEAIDVDTALETAEAMLDRLGFSPKSPMMPVDAASQIAQTANAALLEQARGLIGAKSKVTVSLEVSNENLQPAERGHLVGGFQGERALPAIEGEYSSTEEGTSV
jgi:hypothetical protein